MTNILPFEVRESEKELDLFVKFHPESDSSMRVYYYITSPNNDFKLQGYLYYEYLIEILKILYHRIYDHDHHLYVYDLHDLHHQ